MSERMYHVLDLETLLATSGDGKLAKNQQISSDRTPVFLPKHDVVIQFPSDIATGVVQIHPDFVMGGLEPEVPTPITATLYSQETSMSSASAMVIHEGENQSSVKQPGEVPAPKGKLVSFGEAVKKKAKPVAKIAAHVAAPLIISTVSLFQPSEGNAQRAISDKPGFTPGTPIVDLTPGIVNTRGPIETPLTPIATPQRRPTATSGTVHAMETATTSTATSRATRTATGTATRTATATETRVATTTTNPAPQEFGGSRLVLNSEPLSLQWAEGQSNGYLVVRYAPVSGTFTFLPTTGGRLAPSATTFAESTTPTDPTDCYINFTMGQGEFQVVAISDLLCIYPNTHSGAAFARNFNITLNDSNIATATWTQAGARNGYRIRSFTFDGAAAQTYSLGSEASRFDLDTHGVTTCLVVETIGDTPSTSSFTDTLCSAPGISSHHNTPVATPTAIATFTPTTTATRTETRTLTATRTATASPTRTEAPSTVTATRTPETPVYYTQELDAAGISIRANESVDPVALQTARDIVLQMTNFRPDIRTRLAQNHAAIAIIPRNALITSLPEFSGLDSQSATTRGFTAGNMSAVGEENLLQLDSFSAIGFSITTYEFGHLNEWNGIQQDEQTHWLTIYNRLSTQPGFPNNWADIVYYPPFLVYESEFFSELGRLWQRGMASQISTRDQELYSFFASIYGLAQNQPTATPTRPTT